LHMVYPKVFTVQFGDKMYDQHIVEQGGGE
jgi:hypothetical protein